MTPEQQLIFLFSALGAFNGLLLSGYFLLLKKDRRLSDLFLGGLLLSLSVRIMKSVFLFFNPELFQLFVQVGLSACILIGPFLYLYVTNAQQEDHKLKSQWWWYLTPPLIAIGWLSYYYPFTGPPNSWGPFVGYIYTFWMLCILGAAFQLRGTFRKLLNRGVRLSSEEVWLLNVFGGVSLIFLAYRTSTYTSYLIGALSFSFIFYLSLLLWYYQKNRRAIAVDEPIRNTNPLLTEEEARSTMQQLSLLMEQDRLYLEPELTLVKLSRKIGIPGKELSRSIKMTTQENYSRYIAGLRVAEAQRLLASPGHAHLKISAIAHDSGFNSLSAFNASFKQLTGLTPAGFRKGAEENAELRE
jgi:AraC-like DNA-binding protein